jgi:hypothetical protein
VDRHEAALIGVSRVDLAAVLHRRGKRQRLAAGAGAKIDDLLARLGAGKERGELRAFVLDFDAAFEEQRFGMNCRAFGIRGKTDAKANWRPSRRFGVKMRELGQRVFAGAGKRIDPQVERRAARQRHAFGSTFVAENPRQIRIEPFRIVAHDVRRRVAECSADERRPFRFGQRRGRIVRAAAQRFDRRDIERTLTMQHAD